jgi:isoleucyl-tRNA synthetase
MYILDKYGADAMRYYLASSAIVAAENLNFSEKGVEEALRKNNMILWNVYKFYETYVGQDAGDIVSNNILDLWIIAKLKLLIAETTKQFEVYDLPRSVRPISDFINDLSTWYLRRSRERFKSDNLEERQQALATTRFVLIELAKVMAPVMPFMAENLWQKVVGYNFTKHDRSVHLEAWPEVQILASEEQSVLESMELARKIVEAGLAARDEKGIKIRQPLPYYSTSLAQSLPDDYTAIIKEELNVLELRFGADDLGTELTRELELAGNLRELVRLINALRKNAGLTINDRIVIYWQSDGELLVDAIAEHKNDLLKETLADNCYQERVAVDIEKETTVNGQAAWLGIKKI